MVTDDPAMPDGPGAGQRNSDVGGPVPRADRLGLEGCVGEQREECELVIGFDFGTSTTKIVVHALNVAGVSRWVVRPVGATGGGVDWLWPSEIFVNLEGVCGLVGGAGDVRHRNIKMRLMDAAKCDDAASVLEAETVVAGYLALMLRTARTRILETQTELLQTFETLRWSLNMGVPSGSTADPVQEKLFRCAAEAGWNLSLRPEPLRWTEVAAEVRRRSTSRSEPELDGGDFEMELVPEVIGGAYGYARSDARRDGLHLVVDIGAGTVDACLFRLRTLDDEEQWPLLRGRVEPLGVAELYRRRIEALDGDDVDAFGSFDPLDGSASVPESPWSKDEAPSGILEVDRRMAEEVEGLVGGLIDDAVRRRDPHAREFRKGGVIPVILLGGGSRAEFYRCTLRELGDSVARRIGEHRGFERIPVGVPDNLDLTDPRHSYRLAVAFGLSHLSANLPKYTAPTAIKDIPRPVPERQGGEHIGKECT